MSHNLRGRKKDVPVMVERVSAVDGCNISGVVEEVGANGALSSDRHLLSWEMALLKAMHTHEECCSCSKGAHVHRLPGGWLK